MKDEFTSVESEPAFNGGRFQIDPAELQAGPTNGPRDEIDTLRDSIRNEPWLPTSSDASAFAGWMEKKRSQVTTGGNLWFTLLAALAGGPFAVMGAFMAGQQGILQIVYIVVFGPIIEELLKLSGMIYLLERKPYRLFASSQFILAGAVSASIFAAIENLIYIHVYSHGSEIANPAIFAQFRWTVCTALHVSCSIIASLGLIRVWRKVCETGESADLSFGFPMFATAMALHGVYNFSALFFSDIF